MWYAHDMKHPGDHETLAEPTSAHALEAGDARLSLSVRVGRDTAWYLLSPGRTYVIGRDASADVRVNVPAVSRAHARVTVTPWGAQIEDLGSRNGTWVQGRRIDSPVPFAPGDEVRVGGALLAIHGGHGDQQDVGLLDHGQFATLVDRELDRCRRYRRSLSLLALHWAGARPIAWADMVPLVQGLRAVLRTMDAMGHFGGNQLEVLLPEMDGGEAERMAATLCERLREQGHRVHVGVAVHPVDGTDRESLIAQSLKLSREAACSGMACMRSHGPPASVADLEEIVTCSSKMQKAVALAKRAAQSDITVLVVGETGVGKELVAETIHRAGARCGGPFVRVNCAALPESLIESELFGHERGAFTGAVRDQAGLFEQAEHGTIFLDEIGELPLALQPKLLRVLETRKLRRVGGTREKGVNVRVVAATNRDLARMCSEGSFRADLYYRLAGVTIQVPPLRERPEDIALLTRFFVDKVARARGRSVPVVTEGALAELRRRRWPGNVRELMNAVERALLVSDADMLDEAAFALDRRTETTPANQGLRANLEAVERQMLLDALRAHGNQTRAAEALSMPRRTFVYKMKRYGITKAEYRER